MAFSGGSHGSLLMRLDDLDVLFKEVEENINRRVCRLNLVLEHEHQHNQQRQGNDAQENA
ncbi:MAG: hypothetical protein U1E73_09820 [Planctomycetota bacterium]